MKKNKGLLVMGSFIVSVFLLTSCKPTVNSTNESTGTATSKTLTTSNSSSIKDESGPDAQALSDSEVKRRVVAWFMNNRDLDIAKPDKLIFLDSMKPSWQEANGKTIIGGHVETLNKYRWSIEVDTKGECTVSDSSDSTNETKNFNIFDVTKEQLSQVREDVTTLLGNIAQIELDRRILGVYSKEHGLENKFATTVQSEINSDTREYIATIYETFPRGYGVVGSAMFKYTVKPSGDYTKTEAVGDKWLEEGNIFNELTEDELKGVRENPNELALPDLSIDEFREAFSKSFGDDVVIESSEDMIVKFPSGPSMFLRYNSIAGSVDTRMEGAMGGTEYKYDYDKTQELWDYWRNKKPDSNQAADSISQTELAQRLLVLLVKKSLPDRSIDKLASNGFINLNSDEHGISYDGMVTINGVHYTPSASFTVQKNGDVAIQSLQSGQITSGNIFNDVTDSEYQSVRENITEPN
ncbi:hypothetical protein [Enterococcus sp. AZ109]|uniref:hypothetical protein n=1 Tax=Enterococcus sp. AZ109 TaxID=2774634 RepID=UPI003F2525B9